MRPNRKPARVLIISGIFFPDPGGPAIHARKIAERLAERGDYVTVIAFGDHIGTEPYRVWRVSRKIPKIFGWAQYGFLVLTESVRHDLLYAFDLTTSGIPAAVMSWLFRKPFILRIGGDPIWERIVEKGKRFLPMDRYYEAGLFKSDRPFLYHVIRFAVAQAGTIVTYGDFLSDIYAVYYGVRRNRIVIIKNPIPDTREPAIPEKKTFTFLFAGRFVSYKNLPCVIRSFIRIHLKHPEARLVCIGDGPDLAALQSLAQTEGNAIQFLPKISQPELFAHIRAASVALAPALSEFNPNFILESLALGKPALISRKNGLSVSLPAALEFDPLDEESLVEAMESIMDPSRYEQAVAFVAAIPHDHTWKEVITLQEQLIDRSLSPS